MTSYYIKYVWGPAGQEGYPENNEFYFAKDIIHFSEGSENQCERFKNCTGFLLYETGHSHSDLKGAMAIYAWGVVNPNQENLNIIPGRAREKCFASGVRVILKKRLDPKNGIPLKKIKELTGVGGMQRRGGLLPITEDQFEKLREILEAQ